MGDPEYVTLPPVIAPGFQGIVTRKDSIYIGDSPCIASCKKPQIICKSNVCKRSLIHTVYIVNAIASFAEGYAYGEEHKKITSKK